MKNQKGVISLFVLFAMLFLLVFCLSVYFGIRGLFQTQEYKGIEIQEIYSKDSVENIEYAENSELIPIYNAAQLNIVGTGSYLKINNKIYECGIGRSYVLKNNIIIDIDEDLKYKKIGANDYKIYSETYYIDELGYNIYYYKDGSYWKCLFYEKITDNEESVKLTDKYSQNKFSILDKYKFQNENTFMIVWNDEDNLLTNFDIDNQNINGSVNLNQINVYTKNYKEINKPNGEYYIFVNIGKSI